MFNELYEKRSTGHPFFADFGKKIIYVNQKAF